MAYLTRLSLVTLLIIATLCGANWFVDPFGMYWSPVVAGLNQIKPASGDRVRVTKAYRASETRPEALIVGNSRAEMALYPGHPSFKGARVYNQAMPGAGIALQTNYARNTLSASPELAHIIMSVDYLDFLVPRAQFSALPRDEQLPDYLFRLPLFTPDWSGSLARAREKTALLFSLDGLLASLRTVIQQGVDANSIDRWGFNDPRGYIEILQREGITTLFVQKLQELDRNMRSRDLVTINPANGEGSADYAALEDFLAEMSGRGIRVQLFISPYHISYLHLLDDLGMTGDFLAWKRKLVQTVERVSPAIELWDFSGPSSYIHEPVPADSRQAMQWYWEPAHYRRVLGDKILDTLASGTVREGFGIRLTSADIDGVTQASRQQVVESRDAWLALQRSLGIHIEPLSP
ncbi:MAG: hypothetical protein ACK5HY_14770 [Parahaliea sp.]